MSVLIPGMEMPTWGAAMMLIFPNGDVREMKYESYQWELLGQAIDLPPHGRLIDADALEKDIDKYIGGEESRSRFHHWVQVQSVVIPGNKGEET